MHRGPCEWETSDKARGGGGGEEWSSATMRFRNRRLPSFILKVEVMRVPEEMRVASATGTPPRLAAAAAAAADAPDTHPVADSAPNSDYDDSTPGSGAGGEENPVMRMVAYHEQTIERERKERAREGAGAGTGTGTGTGAGAGAERERERA